MNSQLLAEVLTSTAVSDTRKLMKNEARVFEILLSIWKTRILVIYLFFHWFTLKRLYHISRNRTAL